MRFYLQTHALTGALFAFFAVPTAALAQDTAAESEPAVQKRSRAATNVIVVEGQRIDETVTPVAADLAEFGTQVQIITDKEIETGGFTNFGELAAGLIRGANIGYSPDEGEFTIRIDGGTDRDTLLLVDGAPYFDRSSPLEDLWPATAIDPRMISSVEVYRGGQSLYFGSNGGLGVVSVRTKEPEGELKGEAGFYFGSFKTREAYGNVGVPLDSRGEHSLLFYGRSYETDAHQLFDESSYADNVLLLGGLHEFPYSFNSLGAKYKWQANEDTSLLLGASFTTIDFRDSFPNATVFQPNNTEFPIYTAAFKTRFSDRITFEAEGHFQNPKLKNTEVDARICSIPRVVDLPASAQAIATAQGISNFATATAYETFAATNDLPAGCVTNPQFNFGRADVNSREGFYINPKTGDPYGTLDNPFPIGNPIGYVIQSVASFGNGQPTKGFGDSDQLTSGYIDYGINARTTIEINDYVETLVGAQYTAYKDDSDEGFGVRDVTLSQIGLYGDLRLRLPVLEGLNASVAGRYDINDPFDNQSIWKASLRQNFPMGIYARGSAGTSYSLPKIDEIGAFGPNANLNPGLEPQSVDTMNVGVGIDGEVFGGTFNVELGYFNTQIENLFTNRSIENVCLEYADNPNTIDVIEANRRNIVPPDAFCATAASASLAGNETVAVNALREQDIEGYTVDVALDLDLIQLDFSFTKMDSLEPNPTQGVLARRDGTTTNLDFVIPGRAGSEQFRQSAERPKWTLSGLATYTPSDRWIFALNPRWQGPEYAYAGTALARLVDADGNRVVDDVNFGNYFVLNGSVQLFLGDNRQHRFLVRGVNLLNERYFERYSGGSDLRVSRAAVRGEIGPQNSEYYVQYGWNGKPRSVWLQYEYSF